MARDAVRCHYDEDAGRPKAWAQPNERAALHVVGVG